MNFRRVMMLVNLGNEYLKVIINTKGAEVTSIKNDQNIEYIWQADSNFWGRHAPILFPIVGRLKDDQYEYGGKKYSMGQHGFAREMEFSVTKRTNDAVTMQLKSNASTFEMYPFHFTLTISYLLSGSKLKAEISVINDGSNEMLFSVGAHPAFNVPLDNLSEKDYSEYYINVFPQRTYEQVPFKAPYIDLNSVSDIDLSKSLQLKHEIFYDDAKVIKTSDKKLICRLGNKNLDHGVEVEANKPEYAGLWSAKNAPFVCLEPWWGVADDINADGILAHKNGIKHLLSEQTFNTDYSIKIF
ncbi:aldose 1-epimerase family protein [Apilactobacillus timberlakei]|uniref:Aldose 1-epimerase family protein n=2 Tax=Apilactobacillus timberlakei TaxID=2008380 RepID=A0ABY2YTA3_9LACO|nr:aldose 1-epimerase family protein [Apilactobacillus timberlakei]TPR15223.1 aldose 1-epimerase family protein [Apilactobacillus timberlakei]TPR17114.1 aldose 1-epimerase family protein [Apilactobacillus timberlakei]